MIKGTDIKTSDQRYQSTAKLLPASSESVEENSVFGVAIIYGYTLKLSTGKPYIVVDRQLEQIFSEKLVDMVVIGKKSSPSGCAFFKKFYPHKNSRGIGPKTFHFLPQLKVGEQLVAYSYCGIARESFQPISYRPSLFTPGMVNDCQTNAMQFEEAALRQHFESILQNLNQGVDVRLDTRTPQEGPDMGKWSHGSKVPWFHVANIDNQAPGAQTQVDTPALPQAPSESNPSVRGQKRQLDVDANAAGSSDSGVEASQDSESKKNRFEFQSNSIKFTLKKDPIQFRFQNDNGGNVVVEDDPVEETRVVVVEGNPVEESRVVVVEDNQVEDTRVVIVEDNPNEGTTVEHVEHIEDEGGEGFEIVVFDLDPEN